MPQSKQISVSTDAAHKFLLTFETVRIRILDGFGDPHRKTVCDVNIPHLGQRQKTTDNKGWLKIRCPRSTEYIDVSLQGITQDSKRRVLLEPAWEGSTGIKQRLANLGFYKHDDEQKNVRAFQRAHGLDPDQDIEKHLGEVESDYKTVDDPLEHETSTLDVQTHDLGELGERT